MHGNIIRRGEILSNSKEDEAGHFIGDTQLHVYLSDHVILIFGLPFSHWGFERFIVTTCVYMLLCVRLWKLCLETSITT